MFAYLITQDDWCYIKMSFHSRSDIKYICWFFFLVSVITSSAFSNRHQSCPSNGTSLFTHAALPCMSTKLETNCYHPPRTQALYPRCFSVLKSSEHWSAMFPAFRTVCEWWNLHVLRLWVWHRHKFKACLIRWVLSWDCMVIFLSETCQHRRASAVAFYAGVDIPKPSFFFIH